MSIHVILHDFVSFHIILYHFMSMKFGNVPNILELDLNHFQKSWKNSKIFEINFKEFQKLKNSKIFEINFKRIGIISKRVGKIPGCLSYHFGIQKIWNHSNIIFHHFTSFQIFWKVPIILESNHFQNPIILELL